MSAQLEITAALDALTEAIAKGKQPRLIALTVQRLIKAEQLGVLERQVEEELRHDHPRH